LIKALVLEKNANFSTKNWQKSQKIVIVVNAPPPSVGPEWAELPSNYFAVQGGSCQPNLVAATRFLYFVVC
jgi:hypothetical protein